MRFAIWSGPRNLSTALMYSFGTRLDFAVMDEPFYAAYLNATGADHPMADEIIAQHESDPVKVAALCERDGTPHLYMKHMPHHMLPDFPMGWAVGCGLCSCASDPPSGACCGELCRQTRCAYVGRHRLCPTGCAV